MYITSYDEEARSPLKIFSFLVIFIFQESATPHTIAVASHHRYFPIVRPSTVTDSSPMLVAIHSLDVEISSNDQPGWNNVIYILYGRVNFLLHLFSPTSLVTASRAESYILRHILSDIIIVINSMTCALQLSSIRLTTTYRRSRSQEDGEH